MGKVYVKKLGKGEVLFYQADEERVLYKILSGAISIYSGYGTKQERQLSRMEAGDCFGEMAVLDHQPRSATAVAAEDCSLMVYPEEVMGHFIAENPNFALSIMRGLSAKLRNATGEIAEMQRLLVLADKSANRDEHSMINAYIQKHIEYTPEGETLFVVRV